MKRDMDLIRWAMLQIEEFPPGQSAVGSQLINDAVDQQTLAQHLALLIEERLIDGKVLSGFDALAPGMVMIRGITWKGHEFLDAVRDDAIWSKTKKKVAEVGGSVSTSVLTHVASSITMALLRIS